MKPKLSRSYLENLLAGDSYDSLVELWALLEGGDAYDRHRADYGLSTPLFVFGESLLWFAQSIRSGMVTYFEVAPAERQQLMAEALLAFAPPGFATTYAAGRANWEDASSMVALDNWVEQNDDKNNEWLASLVRQNRQAFESAVLEP